jgi:hypothetical protein
VEFFKFFLFFIPTKYSIGAMCPWGWLQLHPDAKSLAESTMQQLLWSCGLTYTAQYTSTATGAGFAVKSYGCPDVQFNAHFALDILERPEPTQSALRLQYLEATLTLSEFLTCSPGGGSEIDSRASALFARLPPVIPSETAPIRTTHALQRLRVSYDVSRLQRTPAQAITRHEACTVFPGDCGGNCVARLIEVNAKSPRRWLSTGLYAVPGGLVTMRVVRGMLENGLSVRIGVDCG